MVFSISYFRPFPCPNFWIQYIKIGCVLVTIDRGADVIIVRSVRTVGWTSCSLTPHTSDAEHVADASALRKKRLAASASHIPFLLHSTRDALAAQHFFLKALPLSACSASEARRDDKQPSESFTTIGTLKTSKPAPPVFGRWISLPPIPKLLPTCPATGVLPDRAQLRPVHYQGNLIEQVHRFIKPEMGFFSFETAERTLHDDEIMNMRRKSQVNVVATEDSKAQMLFITPPSLQCLPHEAVATLLLNFFQHNRNRHQNHKSGGTLSIFLKQIIPPLSLSKSTHLRESADLAEPRSFPLEEAFLDAPFHAFPVFNCLTPLLRRTS